MRAQVRAAESDATLCKERSGCVQHWWVMQLVLQAAASTAPVKVLTLKVSETIAAAVPAAASAACAYAVSTTPATCSCSRFSMTVRGGCCSQLAGAASAAATWVQAPCCQWRCHCHRRPERAHRSASAATLSHCYTLLTSALEIRKTCQFGDLYTAI